MKDPFNIKNYRYMIAEMFKATWAIIFWEYETVFPYLSDFSISYQILNHLIYLLFWKQFESKIKHRKMVSSINCNTGDFLFAKTYLVFVGVLLVVVWVLFSRTFAQTYFPSWITKLRGNVPLLNVLNKMRKPRKHEYGEKINTKLHFNHFCRT